MILNDKQIIKLAEEHEMISPFVNKSVANGISHGVNPFGYDLRCGSEFKIFTNIKGATADPKNFSEDNFITVKDEESILIPPNSFALAASLEYFKMPRNVTGLVTAKSTYARCGLGVPPTVLEAGWEGVLVLEFSIILQIVLGFMQIAVQPKSFFFKENSQKFLMLTEMESIKVKQELL